MHLSGFANVEMIRTPHVFLVYIANTVTEELSYIVHHVRGLIAWTVRQRGWGGGELLDNADYPFLQSRALRSGRIGQCLVESRPSFGLLIFQKLRGKA
jgi:hypothetical protein